MTPFMTRIGSPGQARCAARCLKHPPSAAAAPLLRRTGRASTAPESHWAPGGPRRATEGRALLTAGRAHALLVVFGTTAQHAPCRRSKSLR